MGAEALNYSVLRYHGSGMMGEVLFKEQWGRKLRCQLYSTEAFIKSRSKVVWVQLRGDFKTLSQS